VRRRAALALILFIIGTATAGLASAQSRSGSVVDIVEAFGVLDAQLAGHVVDRIHAANRDGSALVVLELDTAGGLKADASALLSATAGSRTPIAVWVGPRRAKAASLGALAVIAADVSAIGPSARLGPLLPIDLRGPGADVSIGGSSGATELARQIASLRHHGDPAVFLHRSLGANEALQAGAVDYVVPSVAELLRRLDGRTVTTSAGATTLRLRSDEVSIRFFKPGPLRGMLHTFATTPALAYICLLGGAMLVVFELFQPGFGIAGGSGAVVLAGAIFGLTVLPVGVWAVVMFAAGIALLTLDVGINELGVATIAGTALLLAGSLRLFSAPAGALGLPGWLAVVGTASAVVYFVPVMTLVRRSRRDPETQRAAKALVGMPGQVRSMLNPEGFVWVADALWRARSEDGARVRVGEDVVVTRTDGVLLHVRRSRAPAAK